MTLPVVNEVTRMAEYVVRFNVASQPVLVPSGTLVIEAARLAKVKLDKYCQKGTCGRCVVLVTEGAVRRQGSQRRPIDDEDDVVLACRSVIEADVSISVMR